MIEKLVCLLCISLVLASCSAEDDQPAQDRATNKNQESQDFSKQDDSEEFQQQDKESDQDDDIEKRWSNIQVFLQDEKGDVAEETTIFTTNDTTIEYDVTGLKFAKDDSHLMILMMLADDTSYYFSKNKQYAKRIGSIYLDIDNDASTGEEEFFTDISGFEQKVEIDSGVIMGLNKVWGDGYFPDVPKGTDLDFFIVADHSYLVEDEDSKKIDTDYFSFENPDMVRYSENLIEFRMPFDWSEDLSSGFRVMLLEHGVESMFSEDFNTEAKISYSGLAELD